MKRLLWLLPLLLAGCMDDGLEDLRDFVRTSDAGMRGKAPPAPEPKTYEKFTYLNLNAELPDPFRIRKSKKDNQIDARVEKHNKEPLENFPLEALKMVAYLENKKNGANAIIRAPDGHLHKVKVGNYIGMNNGRITEVESGKITIKEPPIEGEDATTNHMNVLQLDDSGGSDRNDQVYRQAQ